MTTRTCLTCKRPILIAHGRALRCTACRHWLQAEHVRRQRANRRVA